mmetsp:Transcript_3496/g.8698  ORF Transcript_3496/g.8698 Transcript_3496/m.8698 type:complete len:177 (-) Transcript_3496:216-746(-)|eukprot:2769638-Amphidinium_carterae.1
MGGKCCCEHSSAPGMVRITQAEVHDTKPQQENGAYISQVQAEDPFEDTPNSPYTLRAEDETSTVRKVMEEPALPSIEDSKTFYAFIRKREGQKLGMSLAYFPTKQRVKVKGVLNDGAVARWNAENPVKAVGDGQYLLEVNGVKVQGKPEEEVAKLLSSATEITMLLSRVNPNLSEN